MTKEEQKKYTESIRPEEYLRRADEKLPSDSKELKKDYLKLRSENTLLGERCNQLLTDKGKLTDRVQELEALRDILVTENMDLSKTYQDDVTYLKNKVSKLEEENAELKERIETLEQIKREYIDYTIKVEEERTFVKEQLTKAKELLKKVLDLKKIVTKAEEYLLLEEAEQFLSEMEK